MVINEHHHHARRRRIRLMRNAGADSENPSSASSSPFSKNLNDPFSISSSSTMFLASLVLGFSCGLGAFIIMKDSLLPELKQGVSDETTESRRKRMRQQVSSLVRKYATPLNLSLFVVWSSAGAINLSNTFLWVIWRWWYGRATTPSISSTNPQGGSSSSSSEDEGKKGAGAGAEDRDSSFSTTDSDSTTTRSFKRFMTPPPCSTAGTMDQTPRVQNRTSSRTATSPSTLSPGKPPRHTRASEIHRQLLQLPADTIPSIDMSASNLTQPMSSTSTSQTILSHGITSSPKPDKSPQRYLEMLVHNVSHTDLVLNLHTSLSDEASSAASTDDKYCLCRPRFSAFDLYTRRILEFLQQQDPNKKVEVVKFPRYIRNDQTPHFNIMTPLPSKQRLIPTGLKLTSSVDEGTEEQLAVPPDELPNFRVRGRDAHQVQQFLPKHSYDTEERGKKKEDTSQGLYLDHVFFPLLATLLPRWQHHLTQKYAGSDLRAVKKVLVLVSGVGTPRNWTHSIRGNSTEACAELMEWFVRRLYGEDVTVRRIHSHTNIFRYDANLFFCRTQLRPAIDAYRDAHACNLPYPDEVESGQVTKLKATSFSLEWRNSFHVTLSFADGSPARTQAIQACLQTYRPAFLHVWQLKSFWHDTKIVDDDVEWHTFEELNSNTPAMDVTKLDATTSKQEEHVLKVVHEMKAFRQEFLEKLVADDNDILSFWLRKTKKPVLAVLLVQSEHDPEPILYRGTNMEVSMPTGSLCAERNVIGTALATNPGLKREDLRMVAVLAVPLPPIPSVIPGSTIPPTKQDIARVVGVAPSQVAPPLISSSSSNASSLNGTISPHIRSDVARSMSVTSYSSVVEEGEDEDWILGETKEDLIPQDTKENERSVWQGKSNSSTSLIPAVLSSSSSVEGMKTNSTPPGTPVRRITLTSSRHPSVTNLLLAATPNPSLLSGDTVSVKGMNNLLETKGIPDHKSEMDGNMNPNQSAQQSFSTPTSSSTKRTVVLVHSQRDLNPLKPCGACNEWLKKIAECNPYFTVVTFTDADCNGVYCAACEE